MASYRIIAQSQPRKFKVGSEKAIFYLHPALLTKHSAGGIFELAQRAHQGNSKTSVLVEECDSDTFARFVEYIYTGDYAAAEPGPRLSVYRDPSIEDCSTRSWNDGGFGYTPTTSTEDSDEEQAQDAQLPSSSTQSATESQQVPSWEVLDCDFGSGPGKSEKKSAKKIKKFTRVWPNGFETQGEVTITPSRFDQPSSKPGFVAVDDEGYNSALSLLMADHGKNVFCPLWIMTGDCKFVQQGCPYKHKTPTEAKLKELGISHIPSWWQEQNSGSKVGAQEVFPPSVDDLAAPSDGIEAAPAQLEEDGWSFFARRPKNASKWTVSSWQGEVKTLHEKLELSQAVIGEPTAVPAPAKKDATLTHKQAWDNFKALTWAQASERPKSAEYTARPNKGPQEDYREVFLSHARLYVFATIYNIDRLRDLTLSKLHQTLVAFTIYDPRAQDLTTCAQDVAKLLEYSYETDWAFHLRAFVESYVACNVQKLMGDGSFKLALLKCEAASVNVLELVAQRLELEK